MNVDWDAIGAIGEIIGALAVFVSLLILGAQIRQNTRSIRASTRAHVTETITGTISEIHDADFADVMIRAFSGYHQLGNHDRLRFASFMLRMLKVWEDAFFQWTEGDYEEGAWRANRTYLLDTLSQKGPSEFFHLRKPWFDARFVEYVESELRGYDVQVQHEWVETTEPPVT